MKIALYSAVNQNEQNLLRQNIKLLKDYANKNEYQIVSYHWDFKSRSIIDRPGMKELLHYAREHIIEAVIITNMRQLTHDVMDYWVIKSELQKHGVKLVITELDEYINSRDLAINSFCKIMDAKYALEVAKKIQDGLVKSKLKG